MSRHGYSDDFDGNLQLGRCRGQVNSATRGKRGQAFFIALVEALDALPEKRLIKNELRQDGEVCTLGALGARRGLPLETMDPEDHEGLAGVFDVAHQLIQEVEYVNDEHGYEDTPEQRWVRMRKWASEQVRSGSELK